MRVAALLALALLAGCYRLEDLVRPADASLVLVGDPVTVHLESGGTTALVDLPHGLADGDLLTAVVQLNGYGVAPDGWQQDDDLYTGCGQRLVQMRRRALASDVSVDLYPLVGVTEWSAVVFAYRHVSGLGGSLDRLINATTSRVQPPYEIDLPPSSPGELAFVTTLVYGSMGASWTSSSGGRLIGAAAAGGLAVFEQPIADPPPARVGTSDGASGACVALRVQLLLP